MNGSDGGAMIQKSGGKVMFSSPPGEVRVDTEDVSGSGKMVSVIGVKPPPEWLDKHPEYKPTE